MLLIASESSKLSRTVNDVVRELSLSLTIFASTATLAELMAGPMRRIVLLAESDVSEGVVGTLRDAESNAQFGVIVRRGPAGGKLKVFVDGKQVDTIDCGQGTTVKQ